MEGGFLGGGDWRGGRSLWRFSREVRCEGVVGCGGGGGEGLWGEEMVVRKERKERRNRWEVGKLMPPEFEF